MIAFKVETEQEEDGRWLAEVVELPGVLDDESGPRMLARIAKRTGLHPGTLPALTGTVHITQKVFEMVKSEAEWRALLSPEQYRVPHEHGTERAGTSPLDKEYGRGISPLRGL